MLEVSPKNKQVDTQETLGRNILRDMDNKLANRGKTRKGRLTSTR